MHDARIPLDSPLDPNATTPFNTETWDPYIIHATLLLDGKVVSTDIAWPHPIKYLDFPDRDVKVMLSSTKDKLTITAAKPVHGFVFQEKRDWATFSDNGFDIIPGEEVVVKIKRDLREEDLRWTWIGAESGEIGFEDVK